MGDRLSVPLDPLIASSITFQSYDPAAEISGVFRTPLRKHVALEGWFMEYLRVDGGATQTPAGEFDIRQISLSRAIAGRVNAFHLHPKRVQDELWCVLEGTLLVWLIDARADSPTRGNRRKVVLTGEAPELLHIPSGVAHGYRAGPNGGLLLYAMNSQFDPADPNEGRLPWDFFGTELWEEDRG